MNIEKLILCVGTNDIRNIRGTGVKHLKSPLVKLFKKAKTLFPNAKVFVQSLLPLPIQNECTKNNVLNFNHILFDLCTKQHIYYLNLFHYFLGHDGLRSQKLFPGNNNDVHLRNSAIGFLARFYIRTIHSKRFNPLGF